MAKLKANGIEIVRYRVTAFDPDFGRDLIREYSLRSNGVVLMKAQHTDKSWTTWKRCINYAWNPLYTTEAQWRARLREALDKKGAVEEVTR